MTIIDRETFSKLPTEEVAKLVREAGPQVCVFPFNGTRRWFLVERAADTTDNLAQAYVDATEERYIAIYRLCFFHGLDTLIAPIFGGDLFERGNEYTKLVAAALARVATSPNFLTFYESNHIRVRFYGNYRQQFAGTPFDYLCELFDQATEKTATNSRYRLFYGVCGNDASEAVAAFAVQHFQKTGHTPTRKELVAYYYGEYVEAASLFIGFDKFSVFDYPLLGSGEENLYFTVAPSLYMSDRQLLNILYDHIYLRRVEEKDYAQMTKQEILAMKRFYQTNRENTLGVGELRNGIWFPLGQAQG